MQAKSSRLRSAMFWIGGAALAGAAAVQALVSVTETSRPALAEMLVGGTAGSRLALARVRAARAPDAMARDARIGDLVEQSLRLAPLKASAVMLLGLSRIARGDAQGRKLLELSTELSRRDVSTQLWFIRDAAERKDLKAAVSHIHAALRVNDTLAATLHPILLQGLTDPATRSALKPYFARREPWSVEFAEYALTERKNLVGLALLIIDAGKTPNQSLARELVGQLLTSGDFTVAERLAHQIPDVPQGALQSVALREATVDQAYAPITWQTLTDANASVDVVEASKTKAAFDVTVIERRPVALLRKLLLLAPGDYRLTVNAQGAGAAALNWRLLCQQEGAARVSLTELPLAGGSFSIKPDCGALWLDLWYNGDKANFDVPVRIDSITLLRG